MDTIYQNDLTLAQGGSFIEARFLLRREFRPSAMENNLDLPVLAPTGNSPLVIHRQKTAIHNAQPRHILDDQPSRFKMLMDFKSGNPSGNLGCPSHCAVSTGFVGRSL